MYLPLIKTEVQQYYERYAVEPYNEKYAVKNSAKISTFVGRLSTPKPVGHLSAVGTTTPTTEDLLGTASVRVQVENMGDNKPNPVGDLPPTDSPVGGLPAAVTTTVGHLPINTSSVGGLPAAGTKYVGHLPTTHPTNQKKTTKYCPIGASATQEPSVPDVLKTLRGGDIVEGQTCVAFSTKS